MYFADFMIYNRALFNDCRHVLELGCGLGLVGICCALFTSASRITLTDGDPEVVSHLRHNLSHQFDFHYDEDGDVWRVESGQPIVDTKVLKWEDVGGDRSDFIDVDTVIVTDCVYDPEVLEYLVNALNFFFKENPNLKVYIATTIRREETYAMLLRLLGSHRIEWKRVDKINEYQPTVSDQNINNAIHILKLQQIQYI